METTFTYGACLVGGITDVPFFVFINKPLNTATAVEQINAVGTVPSIVQVAGNVAYQVTGIYIDGVNTTQPGAGAGTQGNQVLPPGQTTQGFTGTIGGPI